jgi:hypothetical protein
MKMNRISVPIAVTVLALSVTLLSAPTSQAAKGYRQIARRLVGGVWPRSSAPQLRYFPGSPRGARLCRGKEPHHRAAICGLPIRSDAGVSRRSRETPSRCVVHHGYEGDANCRRHREDYTARGLLVRPVRARHKPCPARRKSDGRYMYDDRAHAETPRTAQGGASRRLAGNVSARS